MQHATELEFHNLKNQHDHFFEDVVEGLSSREKRIPPKYFYDERGSILFDRICQTKEYYPTRTESRILAENASKIMNLLPERLALIELGSGSSIKTRYLLEEGKETRVSAYVPIDISEEHLLNSTARLSEMYQSIPMLPVCADYTCLRSLPTDDRIASADPVVFFPGSTIGNLERGAAGDLLDNIYQLVHGSGYFLIGFDLVKDPSILEAAYNDSQGYTAAFNLNLLNRINHELGGDFDLGAWTHKAFYNPEKERIEMHLLSLRDQSVQVRDKRFSFRKGETIHTESSHKFRREEFEAFATEHGFTAVGHWCDDRENFAVVLLRATH